MVTVVTVQRDHPTTVATVTNRHGDAFPQPLSPVASARHLLALVPKVLLRYFWKK